MVLRVYKTLCLSLTCSSGPELPNTAGASNMSEVLSTIKTALEEKWVNLCDLKAKFASKMLLNDMPIVILQPMY